MLRRTLLDSAWTFCHVRGGVDQQFDLMVEREPWVCGGHRGVRRLREIRRGRLRRRTRGSIAYYSLCIACGSAGFSREDGRSTAALVEGSEVGRMFDCVVRINSSAGRTWLRACGIVVGFFFRSYVVSRRMRALTAEAMERRPLLGAGRTSSNLGRRCCWYNTTRPFVSCRRRLRDFLCTRCSLLSVVR